MKTSYIEQMNAADRNNSLRGYFSSLGDKFRKYTEQSESAETQENERSGGFFYPAIFGKKHFSFASYLKTTKTRVRWESRSNGNSYTPDEFSDLKFRLAKNLNLIQTILYRICHDSIDSSIITEESGIEEVKQAIIWQFVDCVNESDPAYQDVERIRQIIRSTTRAAGREEKSDPCYKDFETGGEKRARIVADYKAALRVTLGDLFDVLNNLVNFSQYLSVVEEMPFSPNSNSSDMMYLREKGQMLRIIILAETVKGLILKYLVSYVKIMASNLPHSFLREAQFSRSILNGSNFMSSEFTGANFTNASLRRSDLSMCALENIDAAGADFAGSTFNYATLAGADLSGAVLNDMALNAVTFLDKRITDRHSYNQDEVKEISLRKRFNVFYNGELVPGDIDEDILSKLARNVPDGGELKKKTLGIDLRPEPAENFAKLTEPINRDIADCLQKYAGEALTFCLEPDILAWVEKAETEGKRQVFYSSGVNYRPANLCSASVKRVSLPDTDFSYVNICGASFDDSDVSGSTFNYNDGRMTNFASVNMGKCRFSRCDLSEATFTRSSVLDSVFLDCKMTGTSFEKALLIDAKFFNTDRKASYLEELTAGASDADPARKNGYDYTEYPIPQTKKMWRDSVYACADMQDCNLQNCMAAGSCFVGMNLDRSVLNLADLKKSFFSNCLLRWSDLHRVNLTYSLLLGTAFAHSALNQSVLANARLFACLFSESNLSGANMISARIDNVLFENCDLSSANLSHARFYNCVFRNVSFGSKENSTETNVTSTHFTNCVFEEAYIIGLSTFSQSLHKNTLIPDDDEMARTLSAANLRIEHSGKFESAEDGKFRTLNSITFY